MRKNGFTLIELLAVIVILAIIALIATPIILGIINDAREKANERSVELYAAAVKNGIAAYQLTGLNAPKSFSDLTIQYDGYVKCTVQELYEDGSFYLEGCKVNNGEKEYSYGTKQVAKGKMSICNPLNVQTEGVYTAGDKYECDVDPEKQGYDYTFYVLNADATSVNLIMDSNINKSGEAVKSDDMEDKGLVAWITKDDYTSEEIGGTEADYGRYGNNNKGPISVMKYLAEATAGWANTNELTINKFIDDAGAEHNMTEYIVNARMPYYSEISDYDENNAYLYDNMQLICYDDEWSEEIACSDSALQNGLYVEGLEHIRGVYGYWTLSSSSYDSRGAWRVDFNGETGSLVVNGDLGVRPVINLSI